MTKKGCDSQGAERYHFHGRMAEMRTSLPPSHCFHFPQLPEKALLFQLDVDGENLQACKLSVGIKQQPVLSSTHDWMLTSIKLPLHRQPPEFGKPCLQALIKKEPSQMCLHKCHGHTSVFTLVMWSASELLIRKASPNAPGTSPVLFWQFGWQLLQLRVQLGDAPMSRRLINFLHACESDVRQAHHGCRRKGTLSVYGFLSGWQITLHNCHGSSCLENQSLIMSLMLPTTSEWGRGSVLYKKRSSKRCCFNTYPRKILQGSRPSRKGLGYARCAHQWEKMPLHLVYSRRVEVQVVRKVS